MTDPDKHASLFAAFDDALEADGFQIAGYDVLDEIDRGGMGVVYHARQHHPEREVALKVMLPTLGAEEDMRKRFQTEARAMAALDHPGILPIYEVGESNGLPYFSMKLATGGSLSDRLKGKPIEHKLVVAWMTEISAALDHAHQRGVLHRDLKPANFLFDESGRLYVADFGVAKLLSTANPNLTKTEGFVGTPYYMPPEIASGSADTPTILGDLYSLGAVFYECLTGESPHKQHSNIASLLRAIADDPIIPPRAKQPRLPVDLEIVCQKALAKLATDRYSSVSAFAEDLQRWQRGLPIHARPVGISGLVWRWMKRHPLPTALLALLLSTGVIGGTLLSQAYYDQRITLGENFLKDAKNERLLGHPGFRKRVMESLRLASDTESSASIQTQAIAALAKVDITLNAAPVPLASTQQPQWQPSLEDGDSLVNTLPSTDGEWTLSWHNTGRLALWQTTEKRLRRIWTPAPLQELEAAFLPDSSRFILTGSSEGAHLYESEQIQISKGLPIDKDTQVTSLTVSPLGKRAAFGNGTGLDVIDLTTQQRLWATDFGPSRCAPCWSADGRFVAASLGEMKEIRLFDASDGRLLLTQPMTGWPRHLAFHPRGRFLAVISDNQSLTLVDLIARTTLQPIRALVMPIEFSKDGLTLFQNSQYSWHFRDAVGYREWNGNAITQAAATNYDAKLSPNEEFLLTATTEGIEIWHRELGRQLDFHSVGNQRIDARTDAWWLPGDTLEIIVQMPGALEKITLDASGTIRSAMQIPREAGTAILDIQGDGSWQMEVLDEDGGKTFECWVHGAPSDAKPLVESDISIASRLSTTSQDGTISATVLDSGTVQLSGKRDWILTPPIPTKFLQVLLTRDGNHVIGIAEDHRVFDWDLQQLDVELSQLGFR